MKIELYTTEEQVIIYWDTEATEQDPLAIQYVDNYTNSNTPISEERETDPEHPHNYRIIKKVYDFRDIYTIDENIEYLYPINHKKNGLVKGIIYEIKEIE